MSLNNHKTHAISQNQIPLNTFCFIIPTRPASLRGPKLNIPKCTPIIQLNPISII